MVPLIVYLVYYFWRDIVALSTNYRYVVPICNDGFVLYANSCIPNTTQILEAQYTKG
jgi:hypothetical protein